ncbi:hypothetical protein FGADI_272 [Fusarium gaditjirri]|uniref:Uncharacterized protein n=1 Tax=Fusarium gaditjirri TaxID=282569 RepID=A0A8H4TP25_9HYPO|nr:hypothetical protein FGADI_272 [Fusarium gaditjirri]
MSLGFDAGTAFTDVFSQVILDIVSKRRFVDGAIYSHASFPKYVSWMMDHGADIAAVVPAGFVPGVVHNATWAHYLMAALGKVVGQTHLISVELPDKVAEVAASQYVVDECKCRCSTQGCTPLVKFLEGLYWHGIPQIPSIRKTHAFRISEVLDSLLPGCKDDRVTYGWIYRATVRYITFCALGLRHTCCELANKGSTTIPDEEEIREIYEEDAVQVQMLEELFSDFEKEFETYPDLADFLMDVWVPKMEHVCTSLNSRELTSEEIRSAEGVGVIWEVCESEDTCGPEEVEYVNPESWARVGDLRSQMVQTNDYKPSAVEEWMRRLDDIAIDPERPVITM